MNPKKNILVCPLDWGLGHATRCVPVINELLGLNFNVIIGADKNPLAFLKQEFPELPTVVIPGYDVTYNEQGSLFKLFCESVRFYNFIKKEHQFLATIIKENNIDIVVSDNRYGLWSKKITSILITHQLYIKTPFGNSIANKKIRGLIANFNECWIPDVKRIPNLSGDLAHLKPFQHSHRFIGPLSRFTSLRAERSNLIKEHEYDILAIISGPEPQRTIFEKLILEQIQNSNLKAVIVRGLPNLNVIARNESEMHRDEAILLSKNEITSSSQKALPRNDDNIKIFNHLSTKEFLQYFQKSKIVVCRAGYSSIMDLVTLGKKAILIPTPGQTEQEYLAQYHFEQGNFYTQKQHEFNIQKGLHKVEKFSPKVIVKGQIKLDFLLKKTNFV